MKKLLKILKIVLPIGLAIYLFWITFKDPERRAELFQSFEEANLFYIFLCLVIAMISHISRAYRWKYLLEPMGYKTKFSNAFYAIMIGYVMNMLIPRAGEISRAAFFSRFEKIPAEKVFGTIAAERVVDIFLLLSITVITFFIERDTAWKKALEIYNSNSTETTDSSPILWLAGIAIVGIIAMVLVLRSPKIKAKITSIISGLWEGLKSIFTTKYKWHYLLHTVIIWGSYILMFYIPFFALEETSHIGFNVVMVAFVFGSFSIVLTPGGTGAYHIAIGMALSLYGYSIATGEALGLIIWFAQAALYIIFGLISLYLINNTNENYLGHSKAN